jgi:hypothetical protein
VEGVKAAVHVVEGPELVQGVGDEEVVEALVEQDLRERGLLAGDGLPAPQVHVVLVPLLPVPKGKVLIPVCTPRRAGMEGIDSG